MNHYFTIGMAGHIDHGKTALTKALTGIETDRLKEEKARSISIEPGFAPLVLDDKQMEVSIIDVPGHEKFIRQMIAGVAGIDMVILVVAADEGMMPQTREHLDILSLLGIEKGLIVMTKMDQAEEELTELVLEDVKQAVKDTFLEGASIHMVDSLSHQGIENVKVAIQEKLEHDTKKESMSSFRMPIDQVFTVKGQGVVVRGTIYDGEVRQGDRLKISPANKEVRVRQLQRHHQQKEIGMAGQRMAINLGGISHEEITRGDVLVANDYYSVSNRLDVAFYPLQARKFKIKQRQVVKLFVGTSEVMGKIIFFDRNEVNIDNKEEILCQIQLNEEVIITRGDHYILRKPTPVETIGGGVIIEPDAVKHRFGQRTMDELRLQKEGSSTDRAIALMKEKIVLSQSEILKQASISKEEFLDMKEDLVEIGNNQLTLNTILDEAKNKIVDLLTLYHKRFPMRRGMNKAEVISTLKRELPVPLLEYVIKVLQKDKMITTLSQYLALADNSPSLPADYQMALESAEKELEKQGAEVEKWQDLMDRFEIPTGIRTEFYYYLLDTNKAWEFDEGRLITIHAVHQARMQLEKYTQRNNFNLQTAKEGLQLTRKNLVPLLELFDRLEYTKRIEKGRRWKNK